MKTGCTLKIPSCPYCCAPLVWCDPATPPNVGAGAVWFCPECGGVCMVPAS